MPDIAQKHVHPIPGLGTSLAVQWLRLLLQWKGKKKRGMSFFFFFSFTENKEDKVLKKKRSSWAKAQRWRTYTWSLLWLNTVGEWGICRRWKDEAEFMQFKQVVIRSPWWFSGEDPTGCGATKLIHHNYWACVLEPVLLNKRNRPDEKPEHHNQGVAPACSN